MDWIGTAMKEFLTNLTKYKALEGKVRFVMGSAGGDDMTRHYLLICIRAVEAVDTQFSKSSSKILNLKRMRTQQVQNPPKKVQNLWTNVEKSIFALNPREFTSKKLCRFV